MSNHPIAAAVAVLVAADPAGCDRVALSGLIVDAQRVRSWLDALDATLARRAAELDEPGLVSGGGRRSSREAATVAARGDTCAAMSELHEALAAGTVAAGHVDAIARVAGQLDDDTRTELLSQATELVDTAAGRRWTASSVTSVTSPAAWKATGWPEPNGSASNDRSAGGSTSRPGCATPASSWTLKPTPASAAPSTTPSPPNEPSPKPTRRGRSTS